MLTHNVLSQKELLRIVNFFKEEVMIKNQKDIALFRPSTLDSGYQEVYLYNRKEMDGLPFTVMPITVRYNNVDYVLMDVRQFIAKNASNILTVTSPGGFHHAILKVMTTIAMQTGRTGIFRAEASLAGNSFVNVIANILTRDWNARHEDAAATRALSAIYYGNMIPSTKDDVDPGAQAMSDIARWAGVPITSKLDRFAYDFSRFEDENDFIEGIRSVSSSPRLKSGISYAGVLTSFSKAAYGPSGVIESLSLGMRCPELYAAVVLFVVGNSMARNTVIGKDMDRFKKKDNYEMMVKLKESLMFDPNDLVG